MAHPSGINSVEQSKHKLNKNLSDFETLLNHLTHEQYVEPLPFLQYTSISSHTRHGLEFISCLLYGYENSHFSYENRKRDRHIEQSLEYTQSYIQILYKGLESVSEDKGLILEDYGFPCQTSVTRELINVNEHLVHHAAIIKFSIAHVAAPIELGENFGVADSTLKYRKEQDRCAS